MALEDMQQSATCVLEVAAEKAEAWGGWLSGAGMLARVQIRTKEDAAPGHCRLEIGASTADLSVLRNWLKSSVASSISCRAVPRQR